MVNGAARSFVRLDQRKRGASNRALDCRAPAAFHAPASSCRCPVRPKAQAASCQPRSSAVLARGLPPRKRSPLHRAGSFPWQVDDTLQFGNQVAGDHAAHTSTRRTVACLGMQQDSRCGSNDGFAPAGEQRRDDAGEHVSAAGRRHPGIAAVADPRQRVRTTAPACARLSARRSRRIAWRFRALRRAGRAARRPHVRRAIARLRLDAASGSSRRASTAALREG